MLKLVIFEVISPSPFSVFSENFVKINKGCDKGFIQPWRTWRWTRRRTSPSSSVHVVIVVVVAVVIVVVIIVVVIVVVVVDDGRGPSESEECEEQGLEDAYVLAVDHQVEHGTVESGVEELEQINLVRKISFCNNVAWINPRLKLIKLLGAYLSA